MKSLEIVNNCINEIQIIEVKGDYRLSSVFVNAIRIAGVKWNDSPNTNQIREKINDYSRIISIDKLQQIKQDLEVLEIIRKKDVNLATLKLCIMRTDTIEQLLSKYNKSRYFTQDELTMEELLKLKQWLEVNENE